MARGKSLVPGYLTAAALRAGAAAAMVVGALWPAAGSARASAPAAPVPIAVQASPVPLDATGTGRPQSGRLRYRGGLALTSPDPAFGGISALEVSADGSRFTAVTDRGHWLLGELVHVRGRLTGVRNVARAPLRGPDGTAVAGSKRLGDAEALARGPDGTFYVGFERTHRIWRYPEGPGGRAEPVPMPVALDRAVANKGIEALSFLADGTLIALTEATPAGPGLFAGWLGTGPAARPLRVIESPPYQITDLARLPGGGFLLLERRYSLWGGVGAQIRKLAAPAGGWRTAPLDGPVLHRSAPADTIDNMEGIALRRDSGGETLVYLVSDDNFSPLQRTLLMLFELAP